MLSSQKHLLQKSRKAQDVANLHSSAEPKLKIHVSISAENKEAAKAKEELLFDAVKDRMNEVL